MLPKPYYEDVKSGITIYNGDCREILPHISADTLITDPVWPNATLLLPGSDRPEALFGEAWGAANGFKRAAIQIGCWTPPFFLSCIDLRFFRHAWLDIARVGYRGRLMVTGDVAYLFGEPPVSRVGHRVIPGRMIDSSCDGKQTDHPCPRKIGHVRWLVNWWSDLDDIICDPFMGGGTTARAAKDHNRKFVGIEIEERFCEMAVKYLSQEVLAL